MLEPTAFDDPPDSPAYAADDRAMRILETGMAIIALLSAILLAVLPR